MEIYFFGYNFKTDRSRIAQILNCAHYAVKLPDPLMNNKTQKCSILSLYQDREIKIVLSYLFFEQEMADLLNFGN